MPVVMLLLILMPLTMAGELCMLCQCLLLGRGRARRRLALLAGAVLLLLAVWLGGGALLETAGLGWRRWVSGGLVAAAAIAAGCSWPSSCPGSCIRCSRGQRAWAGSAPI